MKSELERRLRELEATVGSRRNPLPDTYYLCVTPPGLTREERAARKAAAEAEEREAVALGLGQYL